MSKLLRKLNRQLRLMKEAAENPDLSFKDINSPEYDRQVAEDALYHTIGPLTDAPRWTDKWTSRSTPLPQFVPGGPAPQWTRDEVVMAYAGDLQLLDERSEDNPRSPKYGRGGGSPLYRQAKRVLRQFNRLGDHHAMTNAFNNGLFGLLQMMRKGKDQSRSPFISFVSRSVLGAVANGVGATKESQLAIGSESETGIKGFKALLDVTDANEARNLANQVKGSYQKEPSDDYTPDNPFGMLSTDYYQAAMSLADALESDDSDRIESIKQDIQSKIEDIRDRNVAVRGIGTGSEQAISNPDRMTAVPIKSLDYTRKGEDDSKVEVLNIAERPQSSGGLEPEAVTYALRICLENDLGKIVRNVKKYHPVAIEAGAEVENGVPIVGGRLTVNELRYVIRSLGPVGLNYPGEGVLRSNSTVPRDKLNSAWWYPGEDPEIESIPSSGEIWTSIWKREGGHYKGAAAIAIEMTEEVKEFNRLGIATARTVKIKGTGANAYEEAVSRPSVHAAYSSALVKLKIAAFMYNEEFGDDIDESVVHNLRKSGLLCEDADPIDRALINEAFNFITNRLRAAIVDDLLRG